MPRTRPIKTNFARGEIDPKAQMRSDITAFENGADKIRNAFVFPQGGFRRRPGIEFIDTLPPANAPTLPATPIVRVLGINNVQMIEFKFSLDQLYLLVMTVEVLYIYRDDVLVFEVAHPYLEAEVPFVNYTGSLDTVLLFHPDHETQKLQRLGADSSWSITTFTITNPPTLVFNNTALGTVTPSAATGLAITLTFGTAQGGAADIGKYVRGNGGFAKITAFPDPTYTADVLSDFTDALIMDQGFWTKEEDAFSSTRGWPVSGVLFQGRLCIAGTKDSPQLFAASKSGIIEDFFGGNADADSGIIILGDSEKVTTFDQIRVGRHLQIFGDDSEWYVPISEGTPITPANSTLRKNSSIGSKQGIRTEEVDGVVYFLQRNGGALRDFVFSDKEVAYTANTVSLLASHLVNNPVDVCVRRSLNTDEANYIWHVNTDGTLAVFCLLRSEDVNAWSLQNTSGSFKNCAVLDQDTYFMVDRTIDSVAVKFIEKFNDDLRYDAGVIRPFINFLSLPGTDLNLAFAADASALDITGDLDLRCEVALDDWTTATDQAIVSKFKTAADQRSYILLIDTTGALALVWSVDGIATVKKTSTVVTGFTDGSKNWIRATLDADNGAAGNTVKFYTSPDGVAWTQLGTTVTTGGITSIFSGTAVLEIGSTAGGLVLNSAGKFYRTQVLNGIDGPAVFDADFSKIPVGTTVFTESSTQAATVTVVQTGSPQAEIVTGGIATAAIDLEHLASETVELTLDNAFQGEFVVSALGVLTFPRTAVTSYQLGLSFPLVEGEANNEVLIRTLPADILLPEGSTMGKKKRIVNVSTRVVGTETFLINGNRVPTRKFGPSLLDVPITKIAGEFEIRGLRGYNRKGQIDISQEQPFAMTVLGLAYDIST